MVLYIAMKISRLLSSLLSPLRNPDAQPWWRYISMVNVSATGALVLFFILNSSEDALDYINSSHHVYPLAVKFLPVPVAFLFWLRLMDSIRPLPMRFSPGWMGSSIGAFMAVLMVLDPWLRHFSLVVGVIAGLFVWVPFKECLQRMREQPRATLVMLVAATATINYYWLMRDIWVQLRNWTTALVYGTLHTFGAEAYAVIHPRVDTTIFIRSKSFTIWVNNACNGLEGIFLFSFMLSLMFLLDWQVFRHMKISVIFAVGALYMFFMNAMRITLLYTIGYWAYKLDVPDWVKAMRGWPVVLFHSYIGWVLYLIAFGIFAFWLYRAAGRKKRLRQAAGLPSS